VGGGVRGGRVPPRTRRPPTTTGPPRSAGRITPVHPLDGEFANRAYLALAEHRLWHADAAKEAATRARAVLAKSVPGSVWDRAEVDLLTAELDAALPPAK
jgi:hypothetical protein